MKKKIFKEKCDFVNQVINGGECKFLVKENNINLELLDFVISQLNDDAQKIIYFDFVYRRDQNWWREYYSKSTYYRLKNVALDDFIKKSKEHKVVHPLKDYG